MTAGQFGSLADPIHYSTRNHTALATVNYTPSERLSFFGNFVYNDGRGSLGGLALDAAGLAAIPAGFDYAAVSDLTRFSALNVRRIQQAYGFYYQVSDRWVFTWMVFHGQYKDRQPYLVNTTGRNAGIHAGINLIF